MRSSDLLEFIFLECSGNQELLSELKYYVNLHSLTIFKPYGKYQEKLKKFYSGVLNSYIGSYLDDLTLPEEEECSIATIENCDLQEILGKLQDFIALGSK